MAELEIHHESEHAIDPVGQRVGVLAAVLAVLLAVVTIASHRSHTAAIIAKSEENDAWQHYQSTRVKFHNLELADRLISLQPDSNAARQSLADVRSQMGKYEADGKQIQEEARAKLGAAGHAEHQALRYDIGEGLLEIGLVLSSLYFISRKRLFPVIGVAAGIAGILIAISGLLV